MIDQDATLLRIAFVIDILRAPRIRDRSIIDGRDFFIGDLLA